MLGPDTLRLRALSMGALALSVLAPPLGNLHHHPIDHDGATQHIEAAHGFHTPAFDEPEVRQAASGFDVPAGTAVPPRFEPSFWHADTVDPTRPEHAPNKARAPPALPRSRAPPPLI